MGCGDRIGSGGMGCGDVIGGGDLSTAVICGDPASGCDALRRRPTGGGDPMSVGAPMGGTAPLGCGDPMGCDDPTAFGDQCAAAMRSGDAMGCVDRTCGGNAMVVGAAMGVVAVQSVATTPWPQRLFRKTRRPNGLMQVWIGYKSLLVLVLTAPHPRLRGNRKRARPPGAGPSGSRSTTSSFASRRSWATRRSTPAPSSASPWAPRAGSSWSVGGPWATPWWRGSSREQRSRWPSPSSARSLAVVQRVAAVAARIVVGIGKRRGGGSSGNLNSRARLSPNQGLNGGGMLGISTSARPRIPRSALDRPRIDPSSTPETHRIYLGHHLQIDRASVSDQVDPRSALERPQTDPTSTPDRPR